MDAVVGLVLAAGAGRRMGRPKALLRRRGGTSYVEAACRMLLDAGCSDVEVVLGAQADAAARLLDAAQLSGVHVTINPDWDEGLGTSLRAGLTSLGARSAANAAVIHLVDLPDVGSGVVRRLAVEAGTGPGVRARAAYGGIGGHPVLLGREHWAAVAASANGDHGAREYFRSNPPRLVEVGDLASGRDVDTPADRREFEA